MLPEHVLSSEIKLGLHIPPDNIDPNVLVDYELGGVALNDPTQGLRVKVWRCRVVVDGVKEVTNVYVGAEDVPEVVFFAGQEITEISFTFDQNMNPFFAYIENGQAKFYWYDTTILDYRVTLLPVGSRSPKCCLDDKRRVHAATSDILLAYMREDKLYYREQRDRYEVEYQLASGYPGEDVLLLGMTHVNRVQFYLGLQDYPPGEVNYRVAVNGDSRVAVDGSPRRLVRVSYG